MISPDEVPEHLLLVGMICEEHSINPDTVTAYWAKPTHAGGWLIALFFKDGSCEEYRLLPIAAATVH